MAIRIKVLVTGGSGRIGKRLVPELEKLGHRVVIFDSVEPAQPGDYEFIKGDLQDLEALEKATKGIDAIIHLAAIPLDLPGEYKKLWDVNVTGTFHVLEAARRNGVRKIVFASSVCVWGFGFWKKPLDIQYFPIDEEHPCFKYAQDMYGLSKIIGEQLCYMYTKQFDMSTICLRLASVMFIAPEGGPAGDWLEEFEQFMKPYFQKPESCIDKPERDWVWEYSVGQDVVQAFLLALEKEGVKHAVYNIGATDTPTELDSVELIRMYYPKVPIISNKNDFLADKKRALFDISKAQKELGYKPKVSWRRAVT